MATLNGITIYDESNYQTLVRQTMTAGGGMGAGFEEQSMGGFGSACAPIEYANVPRSEWKDRIEEKKAKGLFPSAWFKRGDVKILNQRSWGYCHTEETEVLTDHGWKQFGSVNDSDQLATVNQRTHEMEFQLPLARQVFDYNGKMLYSTNSRMAFGVTPNHRMYVRKWNESNRSLNDHYEFVNAGDLGWYSGAMSAPKSSRGVEVRTMKIEGDREYSGDDFVALVSLICSDGYAGNSDKSTGYVSFCCFHEGRRPMVAALAERVGFKEQPGRRGVWTRYSAHVLAKWMRQNCYSGEPSATTKKVPQFIKTLCGRQLELFLQYFGDQDHKKPISHFYSSSKGLLDDVQEILLRIGKRASIYSRPPRQAVMEDGHVIRGKESWQAHVYTSDKLSINRDKQIETESYRGPVYCATVPNGTLVTRRENSILVSGNCWMYGVVGAMQLRYAMTGQKAPHLNPFYPAWLGKNGANRGGWGGEALEYIEKYGVPLDSVFSGQPTSRAQFDRHEVKESAKLHKVWKFRELQRNSFQALMNMWLSDNPLPVSQAYNWWGHLVYGIEPVVIGNNEFGTMIGNSWDYSWGEQGKGIIAESKASAAEQICVDMVSTVAA